MPVLLIIAGCNGAGKTTFAGRLSLRWPAMRFVNADEIALSAPHSIPGGMRDVSAGRQLIALLNDCITARADIMLETTLATRRYLTAIPFWQSLGYRVELYYLRLQSPEAAVDRVSRRVAAGGHGIPEPTIRRRFDRSLSYLERYKPIVDAWYVFDNFDAGLDFVMMGAKT